MRRLEFALVGSTSTHWSAGLGRVRTVSVDEGLVAVSCDYSFPYWPGRAHYDGHALRHRVVVYDEASRAIRHVFDDLRFPVHEMAWRPDGGALALACGEYDGGWFYEGELVIWEFEPNRARRPMRDCRYVTRVRWADARTVVVLARPPNDEVGEPDDLYAGTFADAGAIEAQPCDPRSAGFDGPQAVVDRSWFDRDPPSPPDRVWDVAFTRGGARLVTCGDRGGAAYTSELHPLGTSLPGVPCVQLLTHGGEVLVHALAGPKGQPISELHRLVADGTQLLRGFDRVYLFSIDIDGRLLARDTTRETSRRADRILDPHGRDAWVGVLGHFDCFNHSLRVDHAPALFFLRGSPPTSHQAKTLCRAMDDGTVDPLFRWDEPPSHRMEPCATAVRGDELVAGYRLYDPHPGKGERWIEHRSLGSGRVSWRVEWPFAPVALAAVPAVDAVLVATLDGRLAALDHRTGELLATIQLAVGTAVEPMCLAAEGNRIAVGANDGRVLLLELR